MLRLVSLFLTCLVFVNSYRLPKDVLPEHYKLEIISYLGEKANFDFDGKVWITVICNQSTPNITLHSKNLHIHDHNDGVTVTDISSKKPKPVKTKKIELQEENEFLIIPLEEPLTEHHRYEILISFKGTLDDGLLGFYRSSYQDKKTKEKKWLGVTQFEATSARHAFPCFDEPEMKATFDISIGRKEGLKAISNMPLLTTEPLKEKVGWFWDRFDTSVPMSTYLVAWVISDFEYKPGQKVDNNNVTFRIWARKDVVDQVDFASEVGPKVLAYYEKFFNIPYPLPKQDMVAIPDFNAGAMENWGLITYREDLLLYDPKISSRTSQDAVASVIAHELAHQWFGNLVTMKWWTDLWLNEGFATYMASLAVEALFPEWNSLEEEVGDHMLQVFSFDSLRTSHPVSTTIGNPKDIDEIFDTIAYKKGSSLIRMMNLFLGGEVIRIGVSNYLRKHKYGNAEQDDLWYSLTEEAHKTNSLPKELTVKEIMDTWTLQTGYPVVTVIRDYKRKSAEISQKRHLRDIIHSKDDLNPCWWVPLSYSTQSKPEFNKTAPKHWMSCPGHGQVIDNLADENEWIIFNNQMAGIYKVNYDNKNWELITKFLQGPNYKTIPVLNRVQILADAADLGFVGNLKYEIFFKLLKYLKQETEFMPWKAALEKTDYITNRLKTSSTYGSYQEYMKHLLTPIYKKLGGLEATENIPQKLDSIKLLQMIISKSCYFGVSNCISHAKHLFKKFQENPSENKIPKELRGIVYCATLRDSGEEEWNFLWDKYLESNVPTEKSTLLNALGCTEEIWLLRRYLEWSQNSTLIRRQDSYLVFNSVTRNKVGYFIAKSFLYENIDKILKHMNSNKKPITRYIIALASQMSDVRDQLEFEEFIQHNKKHLVEAKQTIQQALESIKIHVQWHNTHAEDIRHIFRKYNQEYEQKS